ncbi:TspO/MBR family protein [Oceanobacillus sp. 1P07AA]|uniref:TspO/MBR family protein n=1 Tax=Oceanobacillus sp. 1P07AA TaxID=3132293 RepID=UPI0039A69695
MEKRTIQLISMYIAFFAMIAVNALANILPLNGYSTGEVSNMYTVYFTPASYTFSIWTVIYIGLLYWLIRISFHKQPVTATLMWIFISTCVFNALWIVFWHYLFDGIALIVLGLHLLSVFILYAYQRQQRASYSMIIPVSIYFGWLIVAFATNIIYFSVATLEVTNSTQLLLAYLALTVIILISMAVLFSVRDWSILLVFLWSMGGIAVKNFSDQWTLSFVTIILMIFLIVITFLYLRQWKKIKNAD